MKKILSLLLVVAIVSCLSLTAFASTEAGLETVYTRTSDGVTVDIYVSNISGATEFAHFLNIYKTDITLVADSLTYNQDIFGTWDFESATTDSLDFKQGSKKITLKFGSTSKTINVTTKTLLASYKFTINDGVTLTEEDFAYNTTNSGLYSCYYTLSSGDVFFNGTYDYIDGVNSWVTSGTVEGTTETKTIEVRFPTTKEELAGGESTWSGASKKGDDVIKHVHFGKAASDLKAGEYYTTYKDVTYYGIVDVTAGNYWAILIVDSTSAN